MRFDRLSLHGDRAMRIATTTVIVLAMSAVVACGGDAGGGAMATTTAARTAEAATPAGADPMSPEALGQQIGVLYAGALSDVTDLLREKPSASQAKASVQQLKETYVQRLVELGRVRESLDAGGRALVDSTIRRSIDSLAGEPWYATYNSLARHYLTEDEELYALIVSFNVIGQYANFELLSEQEPEEAKRLGIE